MNYIISNKKVVTKFILILILSILLGKIVSAQTDVPKVENGVLDLTNWNFEKDGIINLDGKWEFYWEQLLTPEDFKTKELSPEYIYVPQGWATGLDNSKKYDNFGYATYKITVKLPESKTEYRIWFDQINTASKIWINGNLLGEVGTRTTSKENHSVGAHKFQDYFNSNLYPSKGELEIIIQASSYFSGGLYAGIFTPVKLGTKQQIKTLNNSKTIPALIVVGILLIIGIYHIVLFLYRKNEYSTLVFAILALLFVLRVDFEKSLTEQFLYDGKFLATIMYIVIWGYNILMPLFFYLLFKKFFNKYIFYVLTAISTFCFLFFVLTPVHIANSFNSIAFLYLLITIIFLNIVAFRALLNKEQGALWAFLGVFVVVLCNLYDIMVALSITTGEYISAYGFTIYVIFQAINIAERFSISFKNNVKLNKTLDYQNKNLEKIVVKRTEKITFQNQEILEKNEELNQQNEEIQAQADNLMVLNDEVTQKNSELFQQKEEILAQSEELLVTTDTLEQQNKQLEDQNEHITASVRYAKTIQTAVLPFEERIKNYLDLFIIFKPKDIVSGDFYWFTSIKSKTQQNSSTIFIAAVDCTGHGVPGAFMSMIGSQLLSKIVKEDKIYDPAEILLQLHNGIYLSLKQATSDNTDGMDVCLCRIDKNTIKPNEIKVTFSGAKRPLYYFKKQKNTLTRIKGDRKTIGGKPTRNMLAKFTNTEIILQKEDLIYLTTDGYIDQNNSERIRLGSRKFENIISNNANKPLNEQKQILETELNNWQILEQQRDDITVVGIKL